MYFKTKKLTVSLGIFLLISFATCTSVQGQEIAPSTLDSKKYIPMPLPEWSKPKAPNEKSSPFVSTYNLLTQTVSVDSIIIHSPTLESNIVEGFGVIGNEIELSTKSFSNLSFFPDNDYYPVQTNVKLFINRDDGNYICSGTLISPYHVITAGHCVYSHSTQNGWANNITVVPAYQNGSQPYGTSSATQFSAFNGWTNSQDYNWDIGFLTLSKPMGASIGWLGFGYNNNNNHFSGNVFHNFSYPGAFPYNGELLHYQYGKFDNIGSHIVKYNNLAYGGMSGSSHYHHPADGRYIYAILSHGTNSWTGNIRINDDKFDGMLDYITDHRPNQKDLIPVDVNVGAGTIQAGFSLPMVTITIKNYSTNHFSGSVHAEIFLSKDNVSNSSDIVVAHIDKSNVNINSQANISLTASPSALIIPPTLTSGYYYIGVRIVNSDQITNNNVIPTLLQRQVFVDQAPYCYGSDTLTALEGYFSEKSNLELYANNTSCQWIISPDEPAAFIELEFEAFNLAEGDKVEIWDGFSPEDTLLGVFSQELTPSALLVARSGKMVVNFISNEYFRDEGWEANYTVIPLSKKEVNCRPVYPNPAKDKIYLNCVTYPDEETLYRVLSADGRFTGIQGKVLPQKDFAINIDKLSKGVFFLELTSNYSRNIFSIVHY